MQATQRARFFQHSVTLITAIIGGVAVIAAALITARAMQRQHAADDEVARLRGELQRRDAQVVDLQAQLLRSPVGKTNRPASDSSGNNDDDRQVSRQTNTTSTEPAIVRAGLVGSTSARAPHSDPQVPVDIETTAHAVPMTELPLLYGKAMRRPDSVVFGEAAPTALFFPAEKIALRTARKYRRLRMSVGVQDNTDAVGSKRFWIHDHKDQLLFEGVARVGYPPVRVDIDISDCESIQMNSLDYNGQTAEFVRWIGAVVVPK